MKWHENIKYPYKIDQTNLCYSFFDGKFIATPEILEDMFSYYKIHPNDICDKMAPFVSDLGPDEEFDVQQTLERFPGSNWMTIIFRVFAVKPQRGLKLSRLLWEYYIEGPKDYDGNWFA